MKLIIDIPEEEFENASTLPWLFELKQKVQSMIPIPDNATNGDVIKAMFPKDVKVITQHDDIFGRKFIDLRIGRLDCKLDYEWWNVLYQKGGK